MSQSLTVIGNLADDPELSFTQTGKARVTFRVITSRNVKQDDGSWDSVDVTGWTCTAWERLAENIAESFSKGDPVMVFGYASWRSWDNKDGTKGGRLEVDAREVGASVKRWPVKAERSSAGGGSSSRGASSSQGNDPWGAPSQALDDVPPF